MDIGTGDHRSTRQLLITQRLRERRADLRLTQKQVVTRLARCGVWTTNRALSSLEHGAGIDVARLPELAVALDCTVTYLVGLTDDPHRWEPDRNFGEQSPARARPAAPPAARSAPPAVASEPSLIIGGDVPERGLHFGMDDRG
ncbi:MAG TPA: helix-turn-helix transcriptional regulator [Jatrophihabitantaceae bacterium]|jgi:transcriptional regulator with XRE-family HTH domain|nr:helix-turn-helix transcriptional regulator [Jatrophihabitantaceae bacterium]